MSSDTRHFQCCGRFCFSRTFSMLCFLFFVNDTATTAIYTYDTLFPYTTLFRSPRARIHPPVVVGPVNNGRRSRGPDEIDCSGRCLAKDWPNRRRRPLSTACNLVGNGCFSLPAPRSGWSSDVESFRRRQASESLRCPNRGGHEPSYGESCFWR